MSRYEFAGAASVQEMHDVWGCFEIVDLSHVLEEGMPTYPTHAKFFQNPWVSMGDPAKMNLLTLSEHTGTHLDAPSHFAEPTSGAATPVDELEITRVAGKARCMHVIRGHGENWQLNAATIEDWEEEHGRLVAEEIVLIDFGWASRWQLGSEGFSYLIGWPGLARDGAELFVERRVRAVGTDCIGLDAGDGGGGLPAHFTLLPAGVLIYENLTNLDLLSDECYFVGVPLKIRGGTGSPVRAFAFVAR